MKNIINKSLLVSVMLALILVACNLPLHQSTPTSAPTEKPTSTDTPQPAVAVPSETSTPNTINHVTIPSDTVYVKEQVAVDCSTANRMPAGTTQIIISGCDYWNREMLERPADSLTGSFIPSLDIQWSQAGKSYPWVYLQVLVKDYSTPPDGYKVGFELDPDLDSRGEFLLLANKPSSTTWTTDGVQVWQDTNGDVGGTKPFAYDQNTSDGYETKLFDSGVGSDADLAWVRVSPKNPNIIEFAFKAAMLPSQNIFGWWAWVGLSNVAPDKFELVDHDQDAQTWDVDNSCSWIFGKTPASGELVNLCVIIPPTPTVTPTIPNVPSTCHVTRCRTGFHFDGPSCSCVRNPTPTPIIIK